MKVIVTSRPARRLESQVQYLRDQNAPAAAARLQTRVVDYFERHLSKFPRTGRWIEQKDLWEVWIPKTKLVAWYRIREGEIVVVAVWHTSQNRLGYVISDKEP